MQAPPTQTHFESSLRACFRNISVGLAAGRGGWRRCSSVADFSRICALVAPRHPPRRARNPSPDLFSKHALRDAARLSTGNVEEPHLLVRHRPGDGGMPTRERFLLRQEATAGQVRLRKGYGATGRPDKCLVVSLIACPP